MMVQLPNATYGSQKPDGSLMDILGRTYRYDQAYRLKEHFTFSDPLLLNNNVWASSAVMANYTEEFIYDMNGNMSNAVRNALTTLNNPQPMDNFNVCLRS